MFIQYNENPRDNFRAGDCVVRAISVVTGDPWEKIYVELWSHGVRDDFRDRFEELMDEAPDEVTRKKFEKLMMEMR